MLDQGVYLPPSPVEAFFFSSAHSDDDIADTLSAAEQALAACA
jgi:glutamate-1-semialdehyde 2,1-aminomutase